MVRKFTFDYIQWPLFLNAKFFTCFSVTCTYKTTVSCTISREAHTSRFIKCMKYACCMSKKSINKAVRFQILPELLYRLSRVSQHCPVGVVFFRYFYGKSRLRKPHNFHFQIKISPIIFK